jgi:hypothetical protein
VHAISFEGQNEGMWHVQYLGPVTLRLTRVFTNILTNLKKEEKSEEIIPNMPLHIDLELLRTTWMYYCVW